LALGRGEVL